MKLNTLLILFITLFVINLYSQEKPITVPGITVVQDLLTNKAYCTVSYYSNEHFAFVFDILTGAEIGKIINSELSSFRGMIRDKDSLRAVFSLSKPNAEDYAVAIFDIVSGKELKRFPCIQDHPTQYYLFLDYAHNYVISALTPPSKDAQQILYKTGYKY